LSIPIENCFIFFKAEPFYTRSDLVVFQVPSSNQSLIKLLAQNPVLTKIAIKAGGYCILVKQKQLAKFKIRMKELGYSM
jgi:hypothetical protein